MKTLSVALLLIGAGMFNNVALAQSMNQDDVKWINQCIRDNKDEGAKASVIRAYCMCMNEKMSNNETRSITQWEKSHPAAMHDCERKSGWK
jgi:hypothetical protein